MTNALQEGAGNGFGRFFVIPASFFAQMPEGFEDISKQEGAIT
jgi:hypothetical protein